MPPVLMDTREPPRSLPQLDPPEPRMPPVARFTRRETFWIMWGALKAALLIAGVFAAVMIGFVAFLRLVWRV